VDYTTRERASALDVDETAEGSFEIELDCTLVDDSLECDGDNDLEYIFTR
jgi:hypothetical protein